MPSTCNSTKNIKGDRKVLYVEYYCPWAVFKLPDGIDLDDDSVVKIYSVSGNMLYISYCDGREEEITADEEAAPHFNDYDATVTSIDHADDHDIRYSDDEEEGDDEDDDDEECVTNPPYKCDGGCGKIMGDGHDNECVRTCEDCVKDN